MPAVTSALLFFAGFQNTQTGQTTLPPTIRIFPNPAKEYLYVEGLTSGDLVEMYDLQGKRKEQWRVRGERLEIPVSNRWKGMHLLRIMTDEGSWTQKVLLMNE